MGNSVAVVLFVDQNTNPIFNNALQDVYLNNPPGSLETVLTDDGGEYSGAFGRAADYGLPIPSMVFFVRGSDGLWYAVEKWPYPSNDKGAIREKIREVADTPDDLIGPAGGGGIDPNAGTDLIPGWGGLDKTWLIVAGVALFLILRKKN